MLGLADQGLVFDLFEALMAGDAAAVLGDRSTRPMSVAPTPALCLQDLLALTHVPEPPQGVARACATAPICRSSIAAAAAALADRLTIPVLGRAWQMLLKGVAEVEAAPDRRAAAEMVLIRLCYLADQPTPGDLVRRLSPVRRSLSLPPAAGSVRRPCRAMRGLQAVSARPAEPAAGKHARAPAAGRQRPCCARCPMAAAAGVDAALPRRRCWRRRKPPRP